MNESDVIKPEEENLYFVGIGASAGGLEALRPFVGNLPPQSNMVYIIAQHMSPDHKSLMVDLLVRETGLKVEEARHNTIPVANMIYVTPPNYDITIQSGKIFLSKPYNKIGPKPSVDRFFMSMAEDREDHAIGIILSGTGTDGSHGIKAIKTAGGITIAQEPKSAKYDSMPKSAVRAGGADLVLTPSDIATKLSSIVASPRAPIIVEDEELAPPSTIRGIIQQIIEHTGMDFSNYKDATISRQILRRMTALQISTLEDYGDYISRNRAELQELAGNFLICVTAFFRDPEAFEALREEIRGILETKSPGDEIRVWVPGCASGEEVYTISMIFAEELGENRDKYRIQIFATDINSEAVQMARLGVYSEATLAGVTGSKIKKYFSTQDGMFKIDNAIKDVVLFARQDLIQDPPFVRLDLISCRNLLIYFKLELQDQVFKIFHYSLRQNGVLFLGKSESIGKHSSLFFEKDKKHKLYIKRDVSTPLFSGFSRLQSIISTKTIKATEKIPAKTPEVMGHERLFDIYVPPSLLITVDGEILEFFGDCSPFLSFKKGKADFNIFNIILPSLRAELRAFVHRVSRSHESTISNPQNIIVNGNSRIGKMKVHHVETGNPTETDLLVVTFELMDEKPQGEESPDSGETVSSGQKIVELEHEVTLTRENLQTVIEELETANEELQSLNEESQASNEELQASNEELETANEELQASNEELVTVNDELTSRTQELAAANDDLENILNSLHKAILVVDKHLFVTRYNSMATDFFIMAPGQNPNLAGVTMTFDYSGFLDRIGSVIKSTSSFEMEIRKGEGFYLVRMMPYVSNQSNSVEGTVITIEDITEQKISEEKLKLSASVFESASEATLVTDASNHIISVNPAFTKITGYSQEEVLGKNPKILNSGKQSREFFKNMWETLLSTGTWRGEIWNRRKNSQIYPEWLAINILRDDGGSVYRYIAVFSDITDSKKSQELIERQANFDSLTELPNRNLMMDRLEQLLLSSRRNNEIFAVLFMDLDDFKSINDSLGHHHGDELLRKTALRLKEGIRESDSVGRLGGDEFLILLTNLGSIDDIVPIVNKVLSELSRPLIIDGHELHTGASIGVTVYPTDGEKSDVLLRNADGAMYEAKKAGRNTFCFFTHQLQDNANRRHWIANELNIALRQNKLATYYQPIVDLQNGLIIGAEALVRWNHPQKGFIPPEDFISVAEKNGLIGKLGHQVFEQALRDSRSWSSPDNTQLRVSINLSPGQFMANNDLEKLLCMISESELAKSNSIIIEITESLRLSERKNYIKTLEQFRDIGCKIAIDDFGTGFSSLNYIRQLPVDIVKIDRSFINNIISDPEDAAMVKAILTMTQSLNLSVVAEGIETRSQLKFLKEIGCTMGQGYLFSKALPNQEFVAFIEGQSVLN